MRPSSHPNAHRVRWLWFIALLSLSKGSSAAVTPPSNAPTTPPGGGMSLEELRQLAASVGFPNPRVAAAVAYAESAGRPRAANITAHERSFGLWQINTLAHPQFDEEALYDPTTNARAALVISRGGADWTPWSTYTNGAFRAFLGDVA